MGTILQSILGGLLRYVLAGVISWMITNGIANEEQVTQLLAGLTGALILLGWMAFNKIRGRVKLLTALAVPKGTTVAHLETLIGRGLKVPATTPDDAVPVPVSASDSVKPRPDALLVFLLAGSLLVGGCAGLTPAPNVPGTPPPVATLSPEQVNQKAVEFAAVGTAVLGVAQQALEFSHVVIPPSQLRLDINDAASALGRALKDIAIRAKSIVDEPTLRTVYREVLTAADTFLGALGKSTHPQLAEYSTAIRGKLQLIRTFLTGGAQ